MRGHGVNPSLRVTECGCPFRLDNPIAFHFYISVFLKGSAAAMKKKLLDSRRGGATAKVEYRKDVACSSQGSKTEVDKDQNVGFVKSTKPERRE